ncbi:MAG: hypothetical protein Q9170_000751 [Blastenia crenularia]
MARLNEPSTQVESVEALKRRFVRQNREIARVNSTQSLRIRSLESEVSRLLSENITLREQVISLQYEIDSNVGTDSISSVRGKLETKLAELGALVQELGSLQRSAEDRRGNRRRLGQKSSPKKSPDQKNWKNALTISEVTGGADGRLPPIVEGKYYPRRTLDADEMLELVPDVGDAADSPDLGPPPIAHFEAGDPIELDIIQKSSPKKAPETAGEINPTLLVNLETRRRKRPSSHTGGNTTADIADLQKTQQEEVYYQSKPEYHLKSGAKRKFSAREDDDRPSAPDASEGDHFQYSRTQENPPNGHTEQNLPSGARGDKGVQRIAPHNPTRAKEKSQGRPKPHTNLAASNRSVLAPSKRAAAPFLSKDTFAESVNTDAVSSPAKTSRLAEGEKVARQDMSRPRDRSKTRDQPASQRFSRPAKESKHGEESLEVPPRPPKTPVPPPLDVGSPAGSEPPAARTEGRDTPPPTDLDPETANTNAFGSLGRASRRQRGSVSYAEPNLRDKMRRPTRELVDAVGAEERLKERKGFKAEGGLLYAEHVTTGDAPSKKRTVVIKREAPADDYVDWEALPVKGEKEEDPDRFRAEALSPLVNKHAAMKADLPASVVTERRRRPSVLNQDKVTDDGAQQVSGANSAIAALMMENHKAKTRESDVGLEDLRKAAQPSEPGDIYQIQKSPSIEAESGAVKERESKSGTARTSRRHSSISDDRIKEAATRRNENRKDVSHEMRAPGKATGPSDLKKVRSAITLAVEAGEGAQGRGERAANRRRSMML